VISIPSFPPSPDFQMGQEGGGKGGSGEGKLAFPLFLSSLLVPPSSLVLDATQNEVSFFFFLYPFIGLHLPLFFPCLRTKHNSEKKEYGFFHFTLLFLSYAAPHLASGERAGSSPLLFSPAGSVSLLYQRRVLAPSSSWAVGL